MTLIYSNNRGSSLLLVVFLLAAATVTIFSLQGQILAGAQDTSADRGRYLAESTARSCLELAYADAMQSSSQGKPFPDALTYGKEYFPPVRGRQLSCTAEFSIAEDIVTVRATAAATGSLDSFQAAYSRVYR